VEYGVFIHTNQKQMLGAKVAEYALRRTSTNNDKFAVHIVCTDDYPWLQEHEGREYLRDGLQRVWLNDDLQSFTPLRFTPPELMGYQGRAVIMDPDIFAVSDIWELLTRDMHGKAIMCRRRSGPKGYVDKCLASSVMLLDCAKLAHWRAREGFLEMFAGTRDYHDWICLKLEDRDTIGLFENEWNDFDRLTPHTKMLHNTRRLTQPWKTGLPIDWRPAERYKIFPPLAWLMRARRRFFGEYGLMGNYRRHPDANQEHLFFGLLGECLDHGIVSKAEIEAAMASNHIRHDAFEVLNRTRPLAPPGQPPLALTA
jgi:hypothetical protein